MRTYKGLVTKLKPNEVFVFGSNTQGIHGAGAAKWARDNAGAIKGQAWGIMGQSYGIETKDLDMNMHPSISVNLIIHQIQLLYSYALDHSDLDFIISYSLILPDNMKMQPATKLLSGYTVEEIARMFKLAVQAHIKDIPDNIIFEEDFAKLVIR